MNIIKRIAIIIFVIITSILIIRFVTDRYINRDKNGILYYNKLEYKIEIIWKFFLNIIPSPENGDSYFAYRGKPYTGKIIDYYKNGNIHFSGEFRNGTASGKWNYYYENGDLYSYGNKDINEKININDSLNKYWVYYYPNLRIRFRNDTCYFENGHIKYIRNKNYIEPELSYSDINSYDFNNVLIIKAYNSKDELYIDINENGLAIVQDSLKQITYQIGHYKNKLKEGMWQINYYENELNMQKISIEFLNDVYNGQYKRSYFNSNVILEMGNYLNGEKSGRWIENFESGLLKKECIYKPNAELKEYKEYDKFGHHILINKDENNKFNDINGFKLNYCVKMNIENDEVKTSFYDSYLY